MITFGEITLMRAEGCILGLLEADHLENAQNELLLSAKQSAEQMLRETFGNLTRAQLRELEPFKAYRAYYGRWKDTYHVLAQVESILKGRVIPSALPPVTVMFMAELQNGMLTAAYDCESIAPPLDFYQATGTENYTALNGSPESVIQGDWMLMDKEGILSSILRGPAARGAITDRTHRVLYSTYAPEGIADERVIRHLEDIQQLLKQIYG